MLEVGLNNLKRNNMKWEYIFLWDVTLDRLNKLGGEGWELVQFDRADTRCLSKAILKKVKT